MIAVRMASQLAKGHFENRVPKQVFSLDQYPDMVISISPRPGQPSLERSYVLWGLVRIMNQSVRENRFQGAILDLLWQGQSVGLILIVSKVRPSAGYMITNSTKSVEKPTNTTATSVSATTLSWDFKPRTESDVMPLKDVCMGAIGVLVQAAKYRGNTYDQSVGCMPDFKTFYILFTEDRPSHLTKSRVIDTIQAIVTHVVSQRDFREMTLAVEYGVRTIARGSAADLIPPGFSGYTGGANISIL